MSGYIEGELPKYKCNKEVWAVKIKQILLNYEGYSGALIKSYELFNLFVSSDYMSKHKPEPGGYYVKYEDGYESYSPAEAFESGYTII